jgi:hypothetical protein
MTEQNTGSGSAEQDTQGDVHEHAIHPDTAGGRGVARREGFGDSVDAGADESDLARGETGPSERGRRAGPG